MSAGQLVFYSGGGLLVFTIILGIIFWVKKPQYVPESVAYDQEVGKNTRKLRSGYPTDYLTVRREPEQPIILETEVLQKSTAQLDIEQGDTLPDTAVLPNTELLQAQQTEKLGVETVSLVDGTALLTHDENTAQLHGRSTTLEIETETLNPPIKSENTEKLGATTPLSDSQEK